MICMRLKYLFLALSALVPFVASAQFRSGYSDLDDSETVKTLKNHVSYIASAAMEGRAAGSEGEKMTADYVFGKLEEYGVDMLCTKDGDGFGLKRENGDTLRSRNIIGCVQGYDHKLFDRYIVVGARMDNLGVNDLTVDGSPARQIYYGANGNASGVAMMLELAKMVATNSILFRRSVIFVAFGASSQGFAGSWYFLEKSFAGAGKIDAMINLDAVGCGDNFYAYTSSNEDLNAILDRLSQELQPIVPQLTTQEPYPSDHRTFYSKEIPSVCFTTGRYPEHDSPRDTPSLLDYEGMERELEYVYSFTRQAANLTTAPQFRRSNVKPADNRAVAYYDCDVKPTFLGHSDLRWFLAKWVYQYIRYPEDAVRDGIQGTVNVSFAVEKDGSVSDVSVTKGVDFTLDEEALRVIKASPKWKPAKRNGQVVKCYITVPVEFILEKKGKKKK